MKIEILFPEICNLYGDLFNMKYLKDCLPEAEMINTSLNDEPLFASENPDLIYMGTTTERGQQLIIEKLTPYKERIKECIDSGVNFLVTGNAMEIFFKEIFEEDKKVCDGLGIFDFVAKRKARKRFNSLYLGEFKPADGESLGGMADGSSKSGQGEAVAEAEAIKIVGFKSVFGYAYGDNKACPMFMTERGDGLNKECMEEGLRVNNFFATYVVGPLFVLNPTFTKWFMKERLGVSDAKLAFEEAAMEAYELRVKEYSDPGTGIYY